MKNYNLFIAIIGITILFSSCSDWLNVIPQDKMTTPTYFKTEQELRLFSNRFYYYLPTADDISKERADILIPSELELEVSGRREIPTVSSNWSFTELRNINYFLESIENYEDTVIKSQYEGLARFFRALFYFEKVKYYGDIPWYDKVLTDTEPDLFKPRDSREFVLGKMIEDIDFAIAHLSETKHLYKITKWSALGLKSRICLFEGTFRKYHGLGNYENLLQQAADASEEIINSGVYSIHVGGATPYFDMFSTFANNTDEYILARDYDETLNLSHSIQQHLHSSTSSAGRAGLAKKIVNSYLMTDGSRFTDITGYETMTFLEETENRDPRMSQTIRTPGYKPIGGTAYAAPNLAFTNTGYHLIKFNNDKQFDNQKGYNDIPLIRYGEILLNYAEAKAELGTLTQSDLDKSIKLLRDRVKMPNINLAWANANPDPYLMTRETGYPNVIGSNQGIILEIRRERAIELVFEGFRYWDIMRWKEGKAFEQPFLGFYIPGPGVYNLDGLAGNDVCFYEDTKPSVLVPMFLKMGVEIMFTGGNKGNIIAHGLIPREWNEERDYLYPVPTQERILTHGAISQNPGWNDGLNF